MVSVMELKKHTNGIKKMITNAKVNDGNRQEILEYIREKKKNNPKFTVIDVGGSYGAWSQEVVDFIVDFLPPVGDEEKNSHITWLQADINYPDSWKEVDDYVEKHGKFDFSICSHTLEDISCPEIASKKLCEISKEGFISVPSKFREFSRFEGGAEFPYRGFIHHKYVHQVIDGIMYSWPKLNLIESSVFDCIADYSDGKRDLNFTWTDNFEYKIINDAFLGPNVYYVLSYYVNGLVYNKINKKNSFE